jgi:anti-sigma B factor antagonist
MESVRAMNASMYLTQPQFFIPKELNLKLSFEVRETREATVLSCRGRIVYRDEAKALSSKVMEVLPRDGQLVIDLSGVETIDSAGLGELVGMLNHARDNGANLCLVAPNKRVYTLLRITNLTSLFEIHPTIEQAMLAWTQMA